MLKFDMLPLARRLGCEAEVAAYTGPFVGWRFLGAVLQEIPPKPADIRAAIDPVIAGMDRMDRGQDWPEADAAAWAAEASAWAWAAEAAAAAAAGAAAWANDAGVTYARQREILLQLMEAPHAKP